MRSLREHVCSRGRQRETRHAWLERREFFEGDEVLLGDSASGERCVCGLSNHMRSLFGECQRSMSLLPRICSMAL
jgi:hypothetical protein